MEEQIYVGKTQSEKLELLKANCRSSEVQNLKYYFTEDDLYDMKSRLSEMCIEKNGLEEELKDLSKDLRDRIKEHTNSIKHLLTLLKNKWELQPTLTFDFDDQEKGLMLTYNSQGELIGSRNLRPQERQTNIFNITKSA